MALIKFNVTFEVKFYTTSDECSPVVYDDGLKYERIYDGVAAYLGGEHVGNFKPCYPDAIKIATLQRILCHE